MVSPLQAILGCRRWIGKYDPQTTIEVSELGAIRTVSRLQQAGEKIYLRSLAPQLFALLQLRVR